MLLRACFTEKANCASKHSSSWPFATHTKCASNSINHLTTVFRNMLFVCLFRQGGAQVKRARILSTKSTETPSVPSPKQDDDLTPKVGASLVYFPPVNGEVIERFPRNVSKKRVSWFLSRATTLWWHFPVNGYVAWSVGFEPRDTSLVLCICGISGNLVAFSETLQFYCSQPESSIDVRDEHAECGVNGVLSTVASIASAECWRPTDDELDEKTPVNDLTHHYDALTKPASRGTNLVRDAHARIGEILKTFLASHWLCVSQTISKDLLVHRNCWANTVRILAILCEVLCTRAAKTIVIAFWQIVLKEMIEYALATLGVSKESTSKSLIGYRFHVKLRILSPENCKQSLRVKSRKAKVRVEKVNTNSKKVKWEKWSVVDYPVRNDRLFVRGVPQILRGALLDRCAPVLADNPYLTKSAPSRIARLRFWKLVFELWARGRWLLFEAVEFTRSFSSADRTHDDVSSASDCRSFAGDWDEALSDRTEDFEMPREVRKFRGASFLVHGSACDVDGRRVSGMRFVEVKSCLVAFSLPRR